MPTGEAEKRNAAVLGKGVHPKALHRLHEMYPNARVTVRQEITTERLPESDIIRMDGPRFRDHHWTQVFIDLANVGSACVDGAAYCHPGDNFNRRKGIEIAFRRALAEARQLYSLTQAGYVPTGAVA